MIIWFGFVNIRKGCSIVKIYVICNNDVNSNNYNNNRYTLYIIIIIKNCFINNKNKIKKYNNSTRELDFTP